MKRILLFIGLKIAEIAGVVFMPYFIGLRVVTKWPGVWTDCPAWIVGFLTLFILFVACIGICGFIEANWNWAGKILKRK